MTESQIIGRYFELAASADSGVAGRSANARAFARCAQIRIESEANSLAYDQCARVCGNGEAGDGGCGSVETSEHHAKADDTGDGEQRSDQPWGGCTPAGVGGGVDHRT